MPLSSSIAFLDVWVVALLFGGFRLAGLGGAAVLGAARYYLVFALLLAAALVLVVLLRDLLKRCSLAVCSIFNNYIKLDGLVFCWSLVDTFKDIHRVNLSRLYLDPVLMSSCSTRCWAGDHPRRGAGQQLSLVDAQRAGVKHDYDQPRHGGLPG